MIWRPPARRNDLIRCAGLGRPAVLACILLILAAAPELAAQEFDLSRPNAGGTPTRVLVALYLVDLHEITGAEQVFLADVGLRAEWVDPRLAGKWAGLHGMNLDDVWHPRLTIWNQRGATASLPQRVEVDPSGRVSYRQRWFGRFSTRMDLRDFPLDRQRFGIKVVALGYSRAEVDLVIDSENLRSGRAEALSITDWEVGSARIVPADYALIPGTKALAGAQLEWEGRRYTGYYAVQLVLPLAFIVFMGWTALWLDPSAAPPRVTVLMTTMLTLIAYRFALMREVPNLSYLTRFDYFMLGSTVLIFMILLFVVGSAFLVRTGRAPLVHRMDRWARAAFPVAFAVVLVSAWWL
jgi:hypothetical protein